MIELGKHYRTRDGKYRTDNDTLRVLMVDGAGRYPVIGAIRTVNEWEVETFTASGQCYTSGPTDNDLIEIKPRRKGEVWVNCYPEGIPHEHTFYRNPEAADLCARETRIACVRVAFEYEEGEGL